MDIYIITKDTPEGKQFIAFHPLREEYYLTYQMVDVETFLDKRLAEIVAAQFNARVLEIDTTNT